MRWGVSVITTEDWTVLPPILPGCGPHGVRPFTGSLPFFLSSTSVCYLTPHHLAIMIHSPLCIPYYLNQGGRSLLDTLITPLHPLPTTLPDSLTIQISLPRQIIITVFSLRLRLYVASIKSVYSLRMLVANPRSGWYDRCGKHESYETRRWGWEC